MYWPFYVEVSSRAMYREADRIALPKSYLTWPHWKLRDMYRLFDEFSQAPLSSTEMAEYQKAVHLFDCLVEFENDDEAWLKCLMEVKDKDFILQNLACRIGKYPWNQNLWKLYIQFAKAINRDNPEVSLQKKTCQFWVHRNWRPLSLEVYSPRLARTGVGESLDMDH